MKNSKQYIDSLVNKLLKETLEDKANEVMGKLNFKPGKSFDYVQEGEVCESCGSEMNEGECMECGDMTGEVMEKLYGKQSKLDKNKNGRLDSKDFKMMRGKKSEMSEESEVCECGSQMIEGECMECGYTNEEMKESKYVTSKGGRFDREEMPRSRQDIEMTMPGFDMEEYCAQYYDMDQERCDSYYNHNSEGEIKEKLYGRQSRLDKNKNGRLDSEDFKMIRRKKSEMSEMSGKDEVCEGCGSEMGKVQETVYRLVDGNSSELFTENEIIDIIESIVKEEKKKEGNIKKGASPKGYSEYEKAHKGSGKESKDYLDSVAKKLTDYLKDGSKGKYNTNPKQFPKGNGQLAKMDKMAYEIDDEGTDYNMEVGGLNIPDYDGKPPKKETIEKQIKGSSTNGNNQDWANAENTGVNDKFAEYFENDQLAKWKDESYGRVPSPVYEETPKKNKKDGKGKLKEEFDRMKGLIGYDRKTQ